MLVYSKSHDQYNLTKLANLREANQDHYNHNLTW